MRIIGRKEKAARASLAALAVALMLGGIPASAQTDQPAPTPAPSSSFRLPPADDGRAPGVQGPADNGLPPLAPGERRGPQNPAPTPTPAPPPAVVPTRPAASPATSRAAPAPAPAPTASPSPRRAAPAASATTQPAAAAPVTSAAANPAGEGVPPAMSNDASPAPTPGFAVDPTAPVATAPAEDTAPEGGRDGTPLWAWLLAGLAAAGTGLWYWRRRSALAGGGATESVEASTLAAAPARRAPPPQTASAHPAPAPATPTPPARPAPVASPTVPAPSRPSPSALVTRPAAERRAEVTMALEIRGIQLTPEQLVVAFALNLRNEGAVAATGLMVRIALGQGSAMPEAVLARFFDGAGGSVLRDDMILEPGAGEQLSTEVMLPRAMAQPLMIGGKPMLIPVLAFDVTYHWDGDGDAFGQNAGSFVLGREQGASGSEKLAPLPLDRPNLVVNRPGARTTAMRRVQ